MSIIRPMTRTADIQGEDRDSQQSPAHCYRLAEHCIHVHTEDCCPQDGTSDNTATPAGAERREPTECTHRCSEDSGCVKQVLDCRHEHDSECGYTPATEGTPCTYVCEICHSQEKPQIG